MKRPLYQVCCLVIAWALGGLLVVGSILDAISNAMALVSFPLACTVTAGTAVALVIASTIVRVYSPVWVVAGEPIRLKRLGMRPIAGALGIIALVWTPLVTRPAVPTPSPAEKRVILNAFRAGYELSQLREVLASKEAFGLWKNRAAAHLEGLGVASEILRDVAANQEFTPVSAILLRDQVRSKIEALHGEKAASTFVIGADLVPTTRAFEQYLTDGEYRQALAASNVSIFEFGTSINANISDAVFPDELKKAWIKVYVGTYAGDGTPEQLERIRVFRRSIVDHFYQ